MSAGLVRAVLVAGLAWAAPSVAVAQDYVLVDAEGNDIPIEPGVAEAARPSPFPWLRLDDLKATRERPLFSPDRAAAAAAPEPEPVAVVEPPKEPEPAADPPHVRLAGVVSNGAMAVALLQDPETDEVLRLRPGQSVADWVLVAVEPRAIRLKNGDQEVRVVLTADPDAVAEAASPIGDLNRRHRQLLGQPQAKRPADRARPTGTDDNADE
jgi:hypothetical protein